MFQQTSARSSGLYNAGSCFLFEFYADRDVITTQVQTALVSKKKLLFSFNVEKKYPVIATFSGDVPKNIENSRSKED